MPKVVSRKTLRLWCQVSRVQVPSLAPIHLCRSGPVFGTDRNPVESPVIKIMGQWGKPSGPRRRWPVCDDTIQPWPAPTIAHSERRVRRVGEAAGKAQGNLPPHPRPWWSRDELGGALPERPVARRVPRSRRPTPVQHVRHQGGGESLPRRDGDGPPSRAVDRSPRRRRAVRRVGRPVAGGPRCTADDAGQRLGSASPAPPPGVRRAAAQVDHTTHCAELGRAAVGRRPGPEGGAALPRACPHCKPTR